MEGKDSIQPLLPDVNFNVFVGAETGVLKGE